MQSLPGAPAARYQCVCDTDEQANVRALLQTALDAKINLLVTEYNKRLDPDEDLDPDRIRAMIWQETRGSAEANVYDPMQVANTGDFALDVLKNGKEHSDLISTQRLRERLKCKQQTPRNKNYRAMPYDERMDGLTSLEAGIAWLFYKAAYFCEDSTETSTEVLEYKVAPGDNLTRILQKLEKEGKKTTLKAIADHNEWDYEVEKIAGKPGQEPDYVACVYKPGTKTEVVLQPGQTIKYVLAKKEFRICGWRDWKEATRRYNANPKIDYAGSVENHLQGKKPPPVITMPPQR
jgi:hypothetical protein